MKLTKKKLIETLLSLKEKRLKDYHGICFNAVYRIERDYDSIIWKKVFYVVCESLKLLYDSDNAKMLDELPNYDHSLGLWKGVNKEIRFQAIDRLVKFIKKTPIKNIPGWGK